MIQTFKEYIDSFLPIARTNVFDRISKTVGRTRVIISAQYTKKAEHDVYVIDVDVDGVTRRKVVTVLYDLGEV